MPTEKRNRLILAAAALAMSAGYVFAVHLPQRAAMKELQRRTLTTRGECETSELKAAEIPRLQAAVETYRSQFQDFDQRLPRRQELPEFLREISNACMGGQFAGQVIKPGSPKIGQLYNCLPIGLDFQCSYPDLVRMLEGMSRMTRLNRVESLRAAPVGSGDGMLKVQMQVNIYFAKS